MKQIDYTKNWRFYKKGQREKVLLEAGTKRKQRRLRSGKERRCQ